MYKINRTKNNIIKLEEKQFRELGFRERENLQEWIAKNPEVLGEELLIIQKEYQGFNDTNERLDLLALDKDGNLVIVENKLDDTGRDVVWQALKYTSYCSTLTTEQVIRLYQEYLNTFSPDEDAKELILEFLGIEDDSEFLLNSNDQRIVLVANNFRKEVTSTVLWLLNHDVQIQCFKTTPFTFGDDEFLNIEQIIPIPETTEFMIDAKQKEKEKKGLSKNVEETKSKLVDFWIQVKIALAQESFDHLDRVSSKAHWNIGFWKGPGKFAFCIGRKQFRVELYFMHDEEKIMFDTMYKYKDEIQSKLKGIEWQRLDGKKASRIKLETTPEDLNKIGGRWRDKSNWDNLISWYCESMKEFYKVIYPIWSKAQKEINQ